MRAPLFVAATTAAGGCDVRCGGCGGRGARGRGGGVREALRWWRGEEEEGRGPGPGGGGRGRRRGAAPAAARRAVRAGDGGGGRGRGEVVHWRGVGGRGGGRGRGGQRRRGGEEERRRRRRALVHGRPRRRAPHQEGPVQLLLRQVAVVREPAGRGVGGEQRPGPGQAGEPLQQAAAGAPVLLHPAGRLHLAHRAAAFPPAHHHHRRYRRRRRRQ